MAATDPQEIVVRKQYEGERIEFAGHSYWFGKKIRDNHLGQNYYFYYPWKIEQEEDRCPHGMFYTGAGACPACGG